MTKDSTGLIRCWFTEPFLDVMDKWDMSKKNVLEFGAGMGTAWLRKKSKWVDTIESNEEWATKSQSYCEENNFKNGQIFFVNLPEHIYFNESFENRGTEYFSLIPKKKYDIIIVDGIFRDESLKWALNHLKTKGGVIIADNWQQDYVWISEEAENIMKKYTANKFVQPDHTNHEGRAWQTAFWKIPKKVQPKKVQPKKVEAPKKEIKPKIEQPKKKIATKKVEPKNKVKVIQEKKKK